MTDGAAALKLTADFSSAVTASRTVAIAGEAGDVYSFGGWAKADAINPNVEAIEGQLAGINVGTPLFAVSVSFMNGSAKLGDDFTAHFNYGTGQWQMASGVAIAPASYTAVRLTYHYSYNLNTAYFRSPYLYRENFGETYTYDENGNVTSSVDLAETEASFAYQDDRLAMLCNPTGSRYLYGYDQSGNVTAAVSSSGAPNGLQYTIGYDAYGNPIYSEVQSGGLTVSPVSGTEYFILSAMNGQALVHEYMVESTYATVRPWSRTTPFRWRLEASGDGFKLISVTREINSPSPSKKYLQVSETADGEAQFVVSTAAAVSEQTFTFSPNTDGSYRILSAYGALDACSLGADKWSDGTPVSAQTADPDEVTQKWYLVPVQRETSATMGSSAGYAAHLDTVRNLSSTVTAGGEYYLFNAATGQVLGGNVPITWSETPEDPFVFNDLITVLAAGSAENTYFVSKKSNPSSSLRISIAGVALYPGALYMSGTNASFQQEFVLQADGSYLLRSAYSPQYCLDIRHEGLYYNVYRANALSQRWYAVPATAENTASLAALDFSMGGNYQTAVLDSAGNLTTSEYDADTGLLQSVTDPKGSTTAYTYDDAYRILSVLSGQSGVNYAYQNDQLSRIETGTTVYVFAYDGYRRPTLTQILGEDGSPSRTLATNEYNLFGLLEKLTYGNGAAVTYTYDSLDRTQSVSFVDANGVVTPAAGYAYLADGSLGLFKDYLANTRTRYTYDLAGRLVGIRETVGATVDSGSLHYGADYLYEDGLNRLQSVTRHIGGVGEYTDSYTYTSRDLLSRVDLGDGLKVEYSYDAFGRLNVSSVSSSAGWLVDTTYSYGTNADGSKNARPISGYIGPYVFGYTYDANGNITQIRRDYAVYTKYAYDELNQLIYETSQDTNTTTVYTYDTAGNILQKAVYDGYDTTAGTPEITLYTYGDEAWGDLLTAYNGGSITHDAIGNPLTYYDGRTFTWQRGRQLASTTKNGVTSSYAYNADGMRIGKTVNGASTEYVYDGGKLVAAKTEDGSIVFRLDANGNYIGFHYQGNFYAYVHNFQGDVIAIRDATSRTYVAQYLYDAWGNPIAITDGSGNPIADPTHIAHINPIRYRGYYYDAETGFYYLATRYYDPEVGRFLNADGYVSTGQGTIGNNMFAYCGNNPVSRCDPSGMCYGFAYVMHPACRTTDCLDREKHARIHRQSSRELTFSDTEGKILATMYGEVGGENFTTQKAVGHVIKNQLKEPRDKWSGATSYEDILIYSTFNAVGGRAYNEMLVYLQDRGNGTINYAAESIIYAYIEVFQRNDFDFTGGAHYFYDPSISSPSYADPQYSFRYQRLGPFWWCDDNSFRMYRCMW